MCSDAGERATKLRALQEHLGSIPSSHLEARNCNSSLKESDAIFCPLCAWTGHGCGA